MCRDKIRTRGRRCARRPGSLRAPRYSEKLDDVDDGGGDSSGKLCAVQRTLIADTNTQARHVCSNADICRAGSEEHTDFDLGTDTGVGLAVRT